MNLRTLGLSGIEISAMGLGTNYVGGNNLYENVDEDAGLKLVERALELGITHLDTADAYGFGRSEELTGQVIANKRDQVILATKGSNQFGEHGSGPNNDPAYLRGALERSLKRLKTDYIDLYYIHRHDGKTPVEESIGALLNFKQEGLIRAIGVSNFDAGLLKKSVAVGQIDALQSRYNLLQREAEDEVLSICVDHNISFIPWGGLAYGLLGGRYTADFKLDEKDWRHRTGLFDADQYTQNLSTVERLKSLASEHDTTPAELAIQWLLSRPAVSSVIAGAKTPKQVEANVTSGLSSLDTGLIDQVDQLTTDIL